MVGGGGVRRGRCAFVFSLCLRGSVSGRFGWGAEPDAEFVTAGRAAERKMYRNVETIIGAAGTIWEESGTHGTCERRPNKTTGDVTSLSRRRV